MSKFRKLDENLPEAMKVERVMVDVRSNMEKEMEEHIELFREAMGYGKHDDMFDDLFDESDEAIIMNTMNALVRIASKNVTEGLMHYEHETCEPFDM